MERLSSAPLRKTGAIPTVNHGTDMNTSTANLHDTATGTEPAPSALVIDDDELYRHLARAMLESLGWSVETASDGRVGWQMAQLHDFDCAALGFADFGRGENYVARQIRRWSDSKSWKPSSRPARSTPTPRRCNRRLAASGRRSSET